MTTSARACCASDNVAFVCGMCGVSLGCNTVGARIARPLVACPNTQRLRADVGIGPCMLRKTVVPGNADSVALLAERYEYERADVVIGPYG